MVGAQSVLVVTIVDSNLDGDGCIDQTNDSGWYADEVCVASICSTGESILNRLAVAHQWLHHQEEIVGSECLEIIFGSGKFFTQQRR